MYTPGMSVMSLLLKNRDESKRSRDFFYGKEKCFCLFSLFLKRISVPSVAAEGPFPSLKPATQTWSPHS
jgi:hypothetical protein